MDKPEFRVERGPAVKDEAFAIGMAKLLEREGRTIAAAELRRLHAENEALQNTKHYEAPPGFVLNPDYLVPELRAQRDALRAELKEVTEAINDPAVNNLRTLAESIQMLSNQRDALLEALKKAEENGCATVYANEGDEYGERGCCGVVSYMPHADDCWVTMARAAIKAVEEGK